jgi:hypothetical protein
MAQTDSEEPLGLGFSGASPASLGGLATVLALEATFQMQQIWASATLFF